MALTKIQQKFYDENITEWRARWTERGNGKHIWATRNSRGRWESWASRPWCAYRCSSFRIRMRRMKIEDAWKRYGLWEDNMPWPNTPHKDPNPPKVVRHAH